MKKSVKSDGTISVSSEKAHVPFAIRDNIPVKKISYIAKNNIALLYDGSVTPKELMYSLEELGKEIEKRIR